MTKHARRRPIPLRHILSTATAFVLAAVAVSVTTVPAVAQSQNEFLISVTFDGTDPFTVDPLDDIGAYPSPHTPGLDERGNNGVVRTNDTFGVRMDWNINEDLASNVLITAHLPVGLSWLLPPASNPPDDPAVAGCLTLIDGVVPESGVSPDGLTLTCNVGDQHEGSNGTIFGTILVGELFDGDQVGVSATLTTDDDAVGITEAIDTDMVISARPYGDWVKDEPELVENVDNGGINGSLLIFPLTFSWSSAERGYEPVDDSTAITFYDHPWDIPNAELATSAMMPGGRTPCGQFDGALPIISNGTWTCTDIGDQGQGYSTIQIGIIGHNTSALADAVSLHGQIAFWIPQTDLDTRLAIAQPENSVYNSITGSAGDVIGFDKTASNPTESPASDISPIQVAGTNTIADETTTENNSARYSDDPSTILPEGSDPGVARGFVMQTVSMQSGRYQQLSYAAKGDANIEVVAPDMRNDSVGGLHSFVSGSSPYRWVGEFGDALAVGTPISRAEEFFITASIGAQHSRHASVFDDPFAACVSLDLNNYELIPFGNFTEFSIPHDPTGEPYYTTASGSQVLSPSEGDLGHVLTGRNSMGAGTWNHSGFAEEHTGAVIGGELSYAVEFSTDAAQLGNNAPEDGVNCSDSAGTWQDSSTVMAGDFPNISMVRIRMLERVPWTGDIYPAEFSYPSPGFIGPELYPGPMMTLNLQARVRSDVNVQVDGEELFVYVSRGLGDWDNGLGRPQGVYSDWVDSPEGNLVAYESSCRINRAEVDDVADWIDDSSTVTTTTGWCNEPYVDALLPENIDFGSVGQEARRVHEYHADKRYISGVKPLVDKDNVDGVNDYADNGDLVQFSLKPSVEGATAEAVSNVVLIDDLTTRNYAFVQFIQQPSSAPPCTAAVNVVTCQLSEPDPNVDTDPALAQGLPGGWSDEVVIEVVVQGGIAGAVPTFNQNSTTITSTGIGPWDGSGFTQPVQSTSKEWTSIAGSYMPPPVIESGIIKAVPSLEGPCLTHPDQATPPAGWADRCSLIAYDGNMEFSLSLTNEGNSVLNNIRFVDVFPNNSDETEPVSNSDLDGVTTPTLGDGRSPDSDFDGTLTFVSLTAGATTVWLSADDPTTISRDPDKSLTDTTWCDGVGGSVQNTGNSGGGICPAALGDVTATYTTLADPLLPDETYTQTLILDSEGVSCDNIWTNSFGARSDDILLPIRSNDVSVMVNCQYDLALQKTLSTSWSPSAGWITQGASSVDFVIEVSNQGHPVEDFEITDYVDVNLFSFEVADNANGATTGSHTYPFTWDLSNASAPVASVAGVLDTGESVRIPVTLRIAANWPGDDLANYAEVSYFDSDGDPSNGDSNPANPNNPSIGALLDVDSTPDANNNEPTDGVLEDDVINESDIDLSGDGVIDEDDHDIAVVPIWDLELIKTSRSAVADYSTSPPTIVFDITVNNQGNQDAYLVDIIEYVPSGLTYDGVATAALWSAESVVGITDSAPSFTIDGPIIPAGSRTFPLVFAITNIANTPFLNGAEISGFDDNANSVDAANPLAVDVDSDPDSIDDDLVIDHDTNNYDPDSDSNLNEPTAGDSDDHDVAQIHLPFDLALQKRIDPNDVDLLDGISNGDKITFYVEVFNQGDPVEDFDITDYVSDAWSFAVADNAVGATAPGSMGGPVLPYTWDTSDLTAPVILVDGVLGAGSSVLIPIVLTVDVGDFSDTGTGLVNYAEISRFDDDGDSSNGDSDPSNPNNPGSGPLVDFDSTPDESNSDTLIDDRVDTNAAGGDEDDHDIASTIWFDLALIKTTATTTIDMTGGPVTVDYDITVKNQGPEDVLNVEVIDTAPTGFTFDSLVTPPASVTTTAADVFDIDSLASGATVAFTIRYIVDVAAIDALSVNAAEISAMQANYDPDGPNGPVTLGVHDASDIDSVPDSNPQNDNITAGDPANPGPGSDVDFPADSHNFVDFDADGDGNINQADGLDEDDHDTETVQAPLDLALAKTFVSVSGSTVEMLITVTNQAGPIETIEVIDYLDPTMWEAFDVAANTDGVAGGTSSNVFGFTWDANDSQNPIVTLSAATAGERLVMGETLTIPITVTIADVLDRSVPVINFAEISNFDTDNNSANGDAASGDLMDLDSTPDSTNESGDAEIIGADLVDNEISEDGSTGNDEDDHDPVILPIMDLALRKSLHVETVLPVTFAQSVTFQLEIFNQGTVDVSNPTLIDYVDTSLWLAFDPAINVAGNSTGDAALPYVWSTSGDHGIVSITGTIPAGDSLMVPVTLVVGNGVDLDGLINVAEITGGSATQDHDGDLATPPVAVTYPDTGEPILDIDSIPDSVNNDPLIDDVIDNTGGDEDDHDVAMVEPPLYSLGNQVWLDTNNDGHLDQGEEAIGGVIVQLFADLDGDGRADDVNGDGVISSVDAIATTSTNADGGYLFSELVSGDYVVGVHPSNWSPEGELYGYVSSDTTESNGDSDLDDLDNGEAGVDGYVWSDSARLDGHEPLNEPGLNNDVNSPDSRSNLTIDFGFWRPNFDLALRKTLKNPSSPYSIGSLATFQIEVFNQGVIPATDITLIDYLPADMTLSDSDWSIGSNGDVTYLITQTIPANSSIVIDITVLIGPDAAGQLLNNAEIVSAVPLDSDGTPLLMPNGQALPDLDSHADSVDDDTLRDDVIDNANNDEDDHDQARVNVVVTPGRLAETGASLVPLLAFALISVLLGASLIALAWLMFRRRELGSLREARN